MKEAQGLNRESVGALDEGGDLSKKRLEGVLGSRSEGNHEGKGKKQRINGEKVDDIASAAAAAAPIVSTPSAAATIVVDLSYDELMNDKESASLATQVHSQFASKLLTKLSAKSSARSLPLNGSDNGLIIAAALYTSSSTTPAHATTRITS